MWRAFSALSERKQLKIMLRACRLRGWALRMGRARRVPAVDEESAVGLLPEAAPPTDAAAADSQAEQQDDAIDLGTEDLQHADHASEDVDNAAEDSYDQASDDDVPADPDDHACDDADDVSKHAGQEDLGADNLQDAVEGVSKAADQEPGGATKCAYCGVGFSSIDPPEMKYGRLYHQNKCVEWAKPIAIAA